ncbi:MAG TPA: hypothetical protein VOA87_13320 [Thermoanaerobaculia bacterium]|nr:hypothetical protein [Thermoanaerobaculia bacterium]
MKEIGIEIALSSETLLAAAPPASNLIETLRFMPGNALRGVMARRYLDGGGSPEGEQFRRLFIDGEVRFGFAFRDGAEVIPLSARSCKYNPGFPADGGHGVKDLLLSVDEGVCRWPKCGRSMDYFRGYWHPAKEREASIETRLLTRTAIDPARGTASGGQLFSQRTLAEGQTFAATIEAPDDLSDAIASLVREPFEAVLGTGGSRGQGWAEIRSTSCPAMKRGSAKQRYARFAERAGEPVLAVTLLSDGIFRDEYLRDATSPTLLDLAPLGIKPEDWISRPAQAFMDVRRVFGFDGVPIRLPRPPRLAVAAGSSFLFKAQAGRQPAAPKGSGEGWIGEANGEGYGRAVLWHPFHLGVAEGPAA